MRDDFNINTKRTLVDMLKLNERVDGLLTGEEKEVRLAFLSSFTINTLAEVMRAEGFLHSLKLTTYTAPYGQLQQEIRNAKSDLYAFQPDICFLLFDFSDFFNNDIGFSHHTYDAKALEKEVEGALSRYRETISVLRGNGNNKIVASTLPLPVFRPLSVLDNKHTLGFKRIVGRINQRIEDLFFGDPQVFIFDFDEWLGRLGKDNVWYGKFYFLGDLRLEPDAFPALARSLMAYVIPLASATKKCVVLDLDNTLWGGIIGEDGLAGIKLAPTGEGQPFYHFQKFLLSLFRRGVILAINSRNNPEDALEGIRTHPYMILREHHFAAWRINWNDKVVNMRELAKELNIGLDSMVFIDDDPVHIALMNEFLPEVTTIAVPQDTSQLHKIVADYPGFSSFEFTEEDKKRGEMYLAERKRHELQSQATNVDEFLRSLDLRLKIEEIHAFSLPRAAQLTKKTNQFNLTTRRYTEEKIKEMLQAGFLGLTIEVFDKFGTSGICGVAIVKRDPEAWSIDTFLLSCRVLGRGVERAILAVIIEQAKQASAKKVIGEFIPTKKNKVSVSFYKDSNFKLVQKDENRQAYEFDLKDTFLLPPHISIIRDGVYEI